MVDRRRARRQDVDDDDRVGDHDRVVIFSGTAHDGSVGLESRPRVDFDGDAVGEGFARQARSPDGVIQREHDLLFGPDMRQTFGRHHHRDAVMQLPPAVLPLGPGEELVGGHVFQRRGH